MIRPDQLEPALHALQALIARARHQAYECSARKVGDLLDELEYLPQLMADQQLDRTREFRNALQGIAEKHPSCRYVAEQFAHPIGTPRM